ncbi:MULTISPECIES: hypothetical protein [unclassified Duganella]|uniref:hypothetical protein n=1 Tax=unclassified Duganella TaxID=2636909 RepID=UPI000701B09C|nr:MULTISPECIES: hypothetical protein [unclassified Duganella]KQV54466.1 hypothetical protein ASD07_08070 [Duganella sp. Root336D2]KRC03592.1 hypothetical protein ASE26_01795 [Duganella sp. Root198D2]
MFVPVSQSHKSVVIQGAPFDTSISHLSLHSKLDMEELRLLAEFKHLSSASFSGTNLDDIGLGHVCRVTSIENLDLQFTEISNQGLSSLENLPRLAKLRLKENDQLTNDCIGYLTRLDSLVELQIHETSIDQQGIKQFALMGKLRNFLIDFDNCNGSFETVKELSLEMADCEILVKGHGEFRNGEFFGKWLT